MNPYRRKWLQTMMAAGGLAAVAPFLVRRVLAMGNSIPAPGFRKIEGTVKVNGKPATLGMQVKAGDTVTTAENSLAVFVVEQDAYLLRGNSRLEIAVAADSSKILKLLAGKMLSVFGKGEKKMFLPTATLGIRGTGIYVEAEPERSYLCTCYGTVQIQSISNPAVQETVVTKQHENPRYIYSAADKLIDKAPMINHTNDELYMLEALVGRLPAFHQPGGYQGGNPY